MATTGIKRPLKVDVDDFRSRTSTNFSSILTEGHFESACKHYRFSREPFPPPDILDIPALHSLIEQLSLPLVQCIDLIRVKNEASLLPMMFEILKILCRLSSMEISPDARKKELSDEEQQLLMLRFIRESEQAPGSAGVDLLDLLINWEEHYAKFRDDHAWGFVEFCIREQSRDVYKFRIELMDSKLVRGNITETTGFWQAAAEVCTAHYNNCRRAFQIAERSFQKEQANAPDTSAESMEGSSAAPAKKARKNLQLQEQEAWDTAAEREQAGLAAARAAWDQPVYVALTNFQDWVFLKVESGLVTASQPIHSAFRLTDPISTSPTLCEVMQYLALAAGIRGSKAQLEARSAARLVQEQESAYRLMSGVLRCEETIKYLLRGRDGNEEEAKARFLAMSGGYTEFYWDRHIAAARAAYMAEKPKVGSASVSAAGAAYE